MKKILIPTDFSKNSCQVIDYTMKLFKNETCAFYFLNTYLYDSNGLSAIEMLQAEDDWFEKPKEESLQHLGELLERFTGDKGNIKHSYHVISEYASLVEGLEKQVKEIGIDLIVLKGEIIVSKQVKVIIDKVRACPILIVPSAASIYKKLNLTITSTFKQVLRTIEVDAFLNILSNTNCDINILVLEKEETATAEVKNNLKQFVSHLEKFPNSAVQVEYMKASRSLKDYAITHLNSIMCITDKKPGLLRKIGLTQSKAISVLEKISKNPVLAIHQ
ncbi:universal stress protein [Algibacter pectinivorans]|uniref:Universal stress protein family protein n=1 Tax=Algibacter pectinivorans TaxID=870482 RepID=A0A1I1S1D5_9FLAO|nr:universal stress protein [Algibacter pectinivorans]SFD36760.1 Universal stress protein family protein [Algibacter pectinivorans]